MVDTGHEEIDALLDAFFANEVLCDFLDHQVAPLFSFVQQVTKTYLS